MKVLAFLAFAAFVGLSQSASLKKVADCDGTVCPGGCCPEQNWYCCPDGMYCAADASNCPFVGAKDKMIKFAAAKKVVATKKDCDGTVCPGGCCPEQNWYCCPDGMYCAADASNCPFVAAKEKLIKMAAVKKVVATKKDCDGTVCPGGCCPEQNWYCCPDGMYCAADASNCPFVDAKEQLTKLAMKKVVENNVKVALSKKDCDGTVCPGGCCPEQNWYCCPDGMYCAADASNCPFVAAKEKLIKFAAAKKVVATKKDCDGTVCPGGCCPEQNWYCCPDGMYCAANAGNCPFVGNYIQKLAMQPRH